MRTILATALLAAVGCTQGPAKKEASPPPSANSVRLYSQTGPHMERPPAKYEVVGAIDVSGEFDTSGDEIPEGLLNLAKERAAALNADGVLVDSITAVAVGSAHQGEPAVLSHEPQPMSLKGWAIRISSSR